MATTNVSYLMSTLSSIFNAESNIRSSLSATNQIDISNDINLAIIRLKDAYSSLYNYMVSLGIDINSPIPPLSKTDNYLQDAYSIIDSDITTLESLSSEIGNVLTTVQKSILTTMYNDLSKVYTVLEADLH